ncbi:MAG TPA: zinc ribbon domain-containing protein [Thermoplasmata archaeon]|jgi:hypothetical protein
MSAPQEVVAECPSCHAIVSIEATECPRCGELFADEPEPASVGEGTAAEKGTKRPGFREKFLFYTGILLILLGGPGIALGSWLHDAFRISFLNYNAFDAFGGVNRMAVAVGLIVTIVGVVFFVLSLRLSRPSDVEREVLASRDS